MRKRQHQNIANNRDAIFAGIHYGGMQHMYVALVHRGAIQNEWHHNASTHALCVAVHCSNACKNACVATMHRCKLVLMKAEVRLGSHFCLTVMQTLAQNTSVVLVQCGVIHFE